MRREELAFYGIKGVREIWHNPGYEQLYRDELDTGMDDGCRGQLTRMGAVNVNTGRFTGRSPRDKYIVLDDESRDSVWWRSEQAASSDNKPISEEVWDQGKRICAEQLSGKKLYVVDCYCGAVPENRLKVRFVTEIAWQAHYVRNMFIRPSERELAGFKPDFVVLNAARATFSGWKEAGLNSEVFIFFNLSERMCLIGGTWYGGEMKKGIFSMMNYYLPRKGVAAMHCSANVGQGGDTAIFFGLSGTGKTTLSTDPERALIGDDEHGWDDNGIFNFEGGCYAKTIGLKREQEPDIYGAIRRNALLENVVIDDKGEPDFNDSSRTENTRVSYPLDHIRNIVKPVSRAGHAKQVIFLTADAYGVLPPVSFLDKEQMQYYFLSGYTSKVAGTELGIVDPVPSFSACFGAAFLTLHPTVYAAELVKRVEASGSRAYLVNTGWNGRGDRISLKDTRRIINAILDGSLEDAPCSTLPYFHLCLPLELDQVAADLLDPRRSFTSEEEWDKRARKLAGLFRDNFEQYTDNARGRSLSEAGPVPENHGRIPAAQR